jgi:hypothetical protein
LGSVSTEIHLEQGEKQMFLGSKMWLVSGADNLTAIYEPNKKIRNK